MFAHERYDPSFVQLLILGEGKRTVENRIILKVNMMKTAIFMTMSQDSLSVDEFRW